MVNVTPLALTTIASPGTNGQILVSDGTNFAFRGGVYIIGGFSGPNTLAPSQILFGHRFAAAVSYPANFGATTQGPTSEGGSFTAAAASTTINVQKCAAASDPTSGGSWSTIGTMIFASAGHSITFATTGGAVEAFALGDYMRWVAPATPDATLTNVFASLAAIRT